MRDLASIEVLVARCRYPDFTFKVVAQDADVWLQVVCDGQDTSTGEPMQWKGRKWKLSYHMTDTEIVQTAWAAVQRALIHEASELFRFDGVAIFDRHLSVHRLVELGRRDDALDGREPPEVTEVTPLRPIGGIDISDWARRGFAPQIPPEITAACFSVWNAAPIGGGEQWFWSGPLGGAHSCTSQLDAIIAVHRAYDDYTRRLDRTPICAAEGCYRTEFCGSACRDGGNLK
jgi:hypothetical protein